MSEQEEWRPWRVGAYEVSSLGRVRRAQPGRRTTVGRILTPILLKIGYLALRPVVDGKNQQHTVHSMVAEVFLGDRPVGASVNHIDGIKTNNRTTNLEYVTHAENMAHAARVGLMARGERHPQAKLTDAQTDEIRARRNSGESLGSLSSAFGVAKSTVCQIAKGQRRAA